MILHKLVSNAIAGKYLPFALSKLKALNAIFGDSGYFSERWKIENVDIQVQQSPPAQFVRLTGGYAWPAYEFVTSDYLDQYIWASPENPPTELNPIGGIQAHAARVTFNGAVRSNTVTPQAKPIYSTNLKPSGDQNWTIRDVYDYPKANLTTRSDGYFKSWPWWQIQYSQEPQWFYNNKPDKIVTSAFGTRRPTPTTVGLGDFFLSNVIGSKINPYDLGFDLPPTLMEDGRGVTAGVIGPYFGDQVWPRSGAMQIVQRKEGDRVVETRRFFIMGDNKGRLHVYPAKDYFNDPAVIAALGPNPSYFGSVRGTCSTAITAKTVTPDYPAWVTLSDPGVTDVLLWWNWRFNKDATKAATVALRREVRPGYYFYNDPTVYNPLKVWTWRAFRASDFADTYDYTHPLFHTSKRGFAPLVNTPGLIEIDLKIEITGPGEQDYDVTAKVIHSEHFYDRGRYFVDCGYLYNDPRLVDPNDLGDDGKPKQMPEGTLMAAHIDAYYNSDNNTGWYSPFSDISQRYSDPDAFNPDLHTIHCVVDAGYAVRRMDIDREVMRFTLLRNELYIPARAAFSDSPVGPTGWADPNPTTTPIYPIIQTPEDVFYLSDFIAHGPSSSRAPYYRLNPNSSDLSSLSFVIGSRQVLFPTYTTGDTYAPYQPTSRIERFGSVIVVFGEQKLSRTRDAYFFPPWTNSKGNFSYSAEGPAAVNIPEIAPAKRVSFPPCIHTATFFGGIALDTLGAGQYQTLSAHPDGHCIATDADDNAGANNDRPNVQSVFDVVSVKKKDGTFFDGSMRDYFNAAFGQEREYGFWTRYSSLLSYVEVGSFNICGYWLPYTA